KLGQARGVALLTVAENPIELAEYSATQIKIAVAGYGQATKEQVQKMVGALLGLRGPIGADAADALAAAICHIHRRAFQGLVQSLGARPRAALRRRGQASERDRANQRHAGAENSRRSDRGRCRGGLPGADSAQRVLPV